MQIKLFNLRLTAEHFQSDQDGLNAFLKGKKFKKSASQFVVGTENFWSVIVFYEEENTAAELPAEALSANPERPQTAPSQKTEKALPAEEMLLTPEEEAVYQTLRHWRQTKAGEQDLPVFIVAHNSELMEIARSRPGSLEALTKIKGFGVQKTEKYGEEILAVLNAL